MFDLILKEYLLLNERGVPPHLDVNPDKQGGVVSESTSCGLAAGLEKMWKREND